ncbi:hypothetical protein IGI04_006201 [Brassica rapa subsp. trilocularis]|uniref:Uncharacterized protein n=1 Tax=Brassica rapa subsp. trilocularis TaxID=1813537 RepID=A0ABQ7NG70_BRACM|nr:hypothetical protein IGI04_006201 [Brassica rapa subsp. trilocularis]
MVIGVCAWLSQEDNTSLVDLEQHQKQALGVRTNGLRFMDPRQEDLEEKWLVSKLHVKHQEERGVAKFKSWRQHPKRSVQIMAQAMSPFGGSKKKEEAIQAMNKPQESDHTAKTMKR